MDQDTPQAEGFAQTPDSAVSPIRAEVMLREDPNMKVSPDGWNVIKTLYCAGEKATVLGPRFGIRPATINSRASRENWPTPQRVQKAQERENSEEQLTSDPAAALADLWTRRKEQAREDAHNGASRALARFWSLNPTPQNFQEALIAKKLLDQAIDPDAEKGGNGGGNSGQVNNFIMTNPGFAPRPVGPVRDV